MGLPGTKNIAWALWAVLGIWDKGSLGKDLQMGKGR